MLVHTFACGGEGESSNLWYCGGSSVGARVDRARMERVGEMRREGGRYGGVGLGYLPPNREDGSDHGGYRPCSLPAVYRATRTSKQRETYGVSAGIRGVLEDSGTCLSGGQCLFEGGWLQERGLGLFVDDYIDCALLIGASSLQEVG